MHGFESHIQPGILVSFKNKSTEAVVIVKSPVRLLPAEVNWSSVIIDPVHICPP